MSRTYWRSLAQIEERPEFRAALEREFPEGASELPEGVTRREMMMLLGASLSLAGLAGCRRPVEEIVPYVNAPEEIVPGIPRYYATTMPFRRSAYGLIVESHEGRPTKIEGNPLHPSTLGASSSLVQASVLSLYDPDRSQSVTLQGTQKSWSDFVTAWGQLAEAHAADGGAGLAVLSESFSSPTLARLAAELRARYPRLQWATYDAVSDENRLAGLRSATGRDLDLMLRFDRAAVILALDADPLLSDPEMIRHARGFAAGRRAGAAGGAMNRLYAVEGVYSLTGAMADHRLRLESRQIAPFLGALAARLAPSEAGLAKAGVPGGIDSRWIDALAKDLLSNRGKGLIVAGERQPAAVHAAVCALNTYLGNTGRTVSYYETKDAALPSVNALAALVSAMNAGTIKTLIVLGGNPVFDAPADLDFASAMAKVPQSIALGHAVDETSVKATWHIPRAHYLESWGDARAVGGPLSVVQPLILPLFGGRSPVEVLGLMVGGKDRPGYDIVRETWKPILGEAEFDRKWNRVLHDGLLSGSELPEVVPALAAQPLAELGRLRAAGASGDLEVVFLPSPSLHDGRFANDGWLQELPDPVTKLTWDNPALVSPKTAESLGLANEEMIRVDYAGRSLELPVWILPGMADGVVALTLGYGRLRAGRIGSGVGFDTYMLPILTGTWLRQRRQTHQAGAHVSALGDPAPRQHGGAPTRPRVDPDRASIRISLPASARRGRACAGFLTDPERGRGSRPFDRLRAVPSIVEGRHTRRFRGGTASLLTLEGACLRSGPSVGNDDRPELVHRVQRLHDGVPEREQRARRRQDPGREGARDALAAGGPVLLGRALRQPGDGLSASSLHAVRGCPLRAGLPRGRDRSRRAGPQRDGLQPVHRNPLLLEQLSLQGAPVQFLQLHQGHARHPQARDEPGRHGSGEGRHGEVHVLHAEDHPGED